MGVDGASTAWMVIQEDFGKVKKRKAICLRGQKLLLSKLDLTELIVTSSMFTESKSIKIYFASFKLEWRWLDWRRNSSSWMEELGYWIFWAGNKFSGKMGSISWRDALLSSTWLSTLQHWRDQSDKIHICAKEGEMMITICQKDGFTGLRKITTLVIKAMIPISLLWMMKWG